jgi:hypothetical protein
MNNLRPPHGVDKLIALLLNWLEKKQKFFGTFNDAIVTQSSLWTS